MLRALAEFEITGLQTLLPFHRRLLATEQWARGETCRDALVHHADVANTTNAPANATPVCASQYIQEGIAPPI